MSYDYLIGSMGKSRDLKISLDMIAHSLLQNWGEIEIRTTNIGSSLLEWRISVENSLINGNLLSDSQTISLDTGDVTVVAEFAIWYRSLVPQEHKLFLYSGPTWQYPIELFSDTSVEEIVGAINQHWLSA